MGSLLVLNADIPAGIPGDDPVPAAEALRAIGQAADAAAQAADAHLTQVMLGVVEIFGEMAVQAGPDVDMAGLLQRAAIGLEARAAKGGLALVEVARGLVGGASCSAMLSYPLLPA